MSDYEKMLEENFPSMPPGQRRKVAVLCGYGSWQWRHYTDGIVYLMRPETMESMEHIAINAKGDEVMP